MNACDASGVTTFIHRFFGFAAKLEGLSDCLHRLISEETLHGVVVEYVRDGEADAELAAFGLSAFVSEACVEDHLAAPAPHFEFTLLSRAVQGEPVFLTYDELADANAGRGVTIFPMLWLQERTDPTDPEAHVLFGLREKTFWERHRGFRLARIIKEVPAELEKPFLDGGFTEHCRFGAGDPLGSFPDVALDHDSILFTVTRGDVEARWPPTVVGQLFAYQEPRCGFSRAEQQVLIRAADGFTDAKIASALGVSPTAVSLRWRSIYGRVAEGAPAVLRGEEDDASGARGQEKRRTVIAFVDQHPEELRPCASRRRHARAGRVQTNADKPL